ncbi:MAG: protein disulfide oxidoreductase [Aquificaceae bacterium]|nr:MAG: protein disulfide oxidoreductase [Aquificaceae bacterium]
MAQATPKVPPKPKRRWLRYLLEFIIIIALVFAFRAWQQRNMVDGVAPEIQGVLMDGKITQLKNYRGKPVLLHFWATWCPFCKIEEGSITGIAEDWPVLTVAYQSGDKAAIEKHLKERGLESWATISDPDSRLAELYGVTGVPTTFIIDANGNIRFREVGLTSSWGLRARLWYADKMPLPVASDNTASDAVAQ